MRSQGIYLNVSRRNDQCFWDQLLEDSGFFANRKNQDQIYSTIVSYRKRSNYESLRNVYQQLIQPLNSYFLCKNELTKNEKVMSMVRFSINNGSTLEEIASSMGNIQKAASEISTEQSEELVNTQNRESYFSFGVESTHR